MDDSRDVQKVNKWLSWNPRGAGRNASNDVNLQGVGRLEVSTVRSARRSFVRTNHLLIGDGDANRSSVAAAARLCLELKPAPSAWRTAPWALGVLDVRILIGWWSAEVTQLLRGMLLR